MTAPSDVIRKHIEAFNVRDQMADPWSADSEMVTPGGAMTGRDQVLAFLGVFQEAFPDGRLEIKQLLVDGSAAAVEGAFRGTHNGVLHSPAGDIGPTGKSIEFRWAAVYRVEGDQLASEHLFFDQLDFLGQLGIAATPS
jgi:predicted ester cyclase